MISLETGPQLPARIREKASVPVMRLGIGWGRESCEFPARMAAAGIALMGPGSIPRLPIFLNAGSNLKADRFSPIFLKKY